MRVDVQAATPASPVSGVAAPAREGRKWFFTTAHQKGSAGRQGERRDEPLPAAACAHEIVPFPARLTRQANSSSEAGGEPIDAANRRLRLVS